jgi:hypothetical protein
MRISVTFKEKEGEIGSNKHKKMKKRNCGAIVLQRWMNELVVTYSKRRKGMVSIYIVYVMYLPFKDCLFFQLGFVFS